MDKPMHVAACHRDPPAAHRTTLQAKATKDSQAAERSLTRRVHSPTSSARPAPATAAPTAPVPAVSVDQPTASPPPSGGGSSPHHNDPFLVCTRARESGGNYGVVSSGGTYYGAYQFLPSTWNA